MPTTYKCKICDEKFDTRSKAQSHHFWEHVEPTIAYKKMVNAARVPYRIFYFESEEQAKLYSRFALDGVQYNWTGPGWYKYKPGTREGCAGCVSYLPNIIDEMRDQARELTEHADALQKILDEK